MEYVAHRHHMVWSYQSTASSQSWHLRCVVTFGGYTDPRVQSLLCDLSNLRCVVTFGGYTDPRVQSLLCDLSTLGSLVRHFHELHMRTYIHPWPCCVTVCSTGMDSWQGLLTRRRGTTALFQLRHQRQGVMGETQHILQQTFINALHACVTWIGSQRHVSLLHVAGLRYAKMRFRVLIIETTFTTCISASHGRSLWSAYSSMIYLSQSLLYLLDIWSLNDDECFCGQKRNLNYT